MKRITALAFQRDAHVRPGESGEQEAGVRTSRRLLCPGEIWPVRLGLQRRERQQRCVRRGLAALFPAERLRGACGDPGVPTHPAGSQPFSQVTQKREVVECLPPGRNEYFAFLGSPDKRERD